MSVDCVRGDSFVCVCVCVDGYDGVLATSDTNYWDTCSREEGLCREDSSAFSWTVLYAYTGPLICTVRELAWLKDAVSGR